MDRSPVTVRALTMWMNASGIFDVSNSNTLYKCIGFDLPPRSIATDDTDQGSAVRGSKGTIAMSRLGLCLRTSHVALPSNFVAHTQFLPCITMPTTFLHLPDEILGLIVSFVQDHEEILALSLVCRRCCHSTFPRIHHTMNFRTTKRISEFISIVKLEVEDGRPPMSREVRCLVFHSSLLEQERTYRRSTRRSTRRPPGSVPNLSEQLVLEFQTIVPQLGKLQHLIWDVAYPFETPAIFEEFRRWCPQLRSVELHGRGDIPNQSQCLFP